MLKRNLVANYFGQGWVALMGLAFIPLYVKYLGIEAYGLIGLYAVLNAWLGLLDMGMTPTLSREMARFLGGGHTPQSIRDLLRSIEVVALAIAVLIVAGVALSAHWLASSWLKADNLPVQTVSEAFVVMGAVTALRFVEGIYRSSLIGLSRQVFYNVVNSILATVRGLGAVFVLVWVSPTIQAFFFWQGLVSAITLATLAMMTYSTLPRGERSGRFSWEALRGVWRYARGMIGIVSLALLLTQVDKVVLSKLISLAEFGYYNLGAVVAGAIAMFVWPVVQAFFPRLTMLYSMDNHEELARTYHQGAQLVSVAAGSAALVLIVYGDVFLHLWTHDPSLAGRVAPLLRVLSLGALFHALKWIPYQTQLAYGWTTLTVRINFISVVAFVPALFWVVPKYGALGAAWAWVVLNAGYVFVGMHFMSRRILSAEKWKWYFQDTLFPLSGAAAVLLVLWWLNPAPVGFMPQLLSLALAAVSTLAVSALIAPDVRRSAFSMASMFRNYLIRNKGGSSSH